MKITRPYDGAEIVVVENLSTPEETSILAAYSISHYQKLDSVNGLKWRASPPGKPLPYGYSESVKNSGPSTRLDMGHAPTKEEFDKIVKMVEKRAKKVMIEEFPWIGDPRFTPFGDLILRAPGDYMTPHYDGVRGVATDRQPQNLGSIFYITGDLDGGETCYPHFGICYKPVAGSFIVHPGKPEYLHEVSEVNSGWRITMNLFAIKDNEHSLKLLQDDATKV